MDMKKIEVNGIEYQIIRNDNNCIDKELLSEKITDYFDPFDYILGDYAYDKLRLKGFCNKNNELYNDINDYDRINEYIKNQCAYECKYFVLKKIEK